MKARHILALVAAVATGVAAVVALLVPAVDGPAPNTDVDGTEAAEGLMDGWPNRDLDIGTFGFAASFGSRLDGWANRDLDIGALATAADPGSILDGWGNRDMDIGTFGFAAAFGSLLDGWANRDLDIGPGY